MSESPLTPKTLKQRNIDQARIAKSMPPGRERDRILWIIVLENDRLTRHAVEAVVQKMGRSTTEDDLQVGRIGMYEAVSRWNPDIAQLSTYAVWWIRVALQRQSHPHPAGAHVPSDLKTLRPMVLECERHLAVRGKPCTPAHIAQELDLPEEHVQAVFGLSQSTTTYKTIESEPDGYEQPVAAPPMEDLLQIHGPRMQAVLKRMEPRMRSVLIGFANGLSFSEMGAEIGVSRERARQILDMAFTTLRDATIVVDEDARRQALLKRLTEIDEANSSEGY